MQNLREPSFLCAKTTVLAHRLFNLCMAPISIISFKCFLTSSYWWGGILWYLSLKGMLFSRLMLWLTREVFPSSRSSEAKRLWYSTIKSLTSFCSFSDYPSKPERSSFSKSLISHLGIGWVCILGELGCMGSFVESLSILGCRCVVADFSATLGANIGVTLLAANMDHHHPSFQSDLSTR